MDGRIHTIPGTRRITTQTLTLGTSLVTPSNVIGLEGDSFEAVASTLAYSMSTTTTAVSDVLLSTTASVNDMESRNTTMQTLITSLSTTLTSNSNVVTSLNSLVTYVDNADFWSLDFSAMPELPTEVTTNISAVSNQLSDAEADLATKNSVISTLSTTVVSLGVDATDAIIVGNNYQMAALSDLRWAISDQTSVSVTALSSVHAVLSSAVSDTVTSVATESATVDAWTASTVATDRTVRHRINELLFLAPTPAVSGSEHVGLIAGMSNYLASVALALHSNGVLGETDPVWNARRYLASTLTLDEGTTYSEYYTDSSKIAVSSLTALYATDDTVPKLLASVALDLFVSDVTVGDDVVPTAATFASSGVVAYGNESGEVYWLDTTDPGTATAVTGLGASSRVTGMGTSGTRLLVAFGDHPSRVVDVGVGPSLTVDGDVDLSYLNMAGMRNIRGVVNPDEEGPATWVGEVPDTVSDETPTLVVVNTFTEGAYVEDFVEDIAEVSAWAMNRAGVVAAVHGDGRYPDGDVVAFDALSVATTGVAQLDSVATGVEITGVSVTEEDSSVVVAGSLVDDDENGVLDVSKYQSVSDRFQNELLASDLSGISELASVSAVAQQSDGTIWAAGIPTSGSTPCVARREAGESTWTVVTGVTGSVNAMVVDSEDYVYVGGSFSEKLLRVAPDGTSVTAMTSDVSGGDVHALALGFDPDEPLYVTQQFTTVGSTTWRVPLYVTEVEYLVVGGGGGGSGAYNVGGGGGGGGGMVRAATGFSVTPGSQVTVTVGAGGTGGTATQIDGDTNGTEGGDSVFGSIRSLGGQGGFRTLATRLGTGGAAGSLDPLTAPSGGKGGRLLEGVIRGGGGGGSMEESGFSVGPPDITMGQFGGMATTSSLSGSLIYYAYGGHGGSALNKLEDLVPINGIAGRPNRGDGGNGGSAKSGSVASGGNGGSGIVIIKYAVPSRLYVGGSFSAPYQNAYFVDLKPEFALSNSAQLGSTALVASASDKRVTGMAIDSTAKKVYVGMTDGVSLDGGSETALMVFDEATGTLTADPLFGSTTVRSLALTSDSLYVSGDFTELEGVPTPRIVRIALSDTSINTMGTSGLVGGYATSMVVVPSRITASADKLLLGGTFASADGVSGTARVALWNPGTSAFESVGVTQETLSEAVTALFVSSDDKLWVSQTPAPATTSSSTALARSTKALSGQTAYGDIGVRVQKLFPDSATALGPVQALVGDYVALFVVLSGTSARLYVHELPPVARVETYDDFLASTLVDGVFGASSLRLEWIPKSALPGGYSVTHGLLLAQSVNDSGQAVARLYNWNHTTKTLDHVQDLFLAEDPSDSLHVMQPVSRIAGSLGFVSVSQSQGRIRVWGTDVAGNVYAPVLTV